MQSSDTASNSRSPGTPGLFCIQSEGCRRLLTDGLAAVALTAILCLMPTQAGGADDAEEMRAAFNRAQKRLTDGDAPSALERFESLAKRYPQTEWAALAWWECFRIRESLGEPEAAFAALQTLVTRHPGHFEKAHAEQFKLMQRLLASGKGARRTLELESKAEPPTAATLVQMLHKVVTNGPFSETGIQAQHLLGIALEKEGETDAAILQHEEFIELHPKHELADDAAYQIAYIRYKAWRTARSTGNRQRDAAAMALNFFLERYPESDKAAHARAGLAEVRLAEQKELISLAGYYEAKGNTKAAAVYYRQLATRFPELAQADSPLRDKIVEAVKVESGQRADVVGPERPASDNLGER